MLLCCKLSLQEEEQKRLEEEMRKRRERIELWRAERKKAESSEGVKQMVKNATAAGRSSRCKILTMFNFSI